MAADFDALTKLSKYQSETIFIGSMAFLGAYVWMIGRLINRINNNDMSPITYHFLSIRIITACLVAGIARHIVEALPIQSLIYKDGQPVGLAVLGFLIGWNPTLWINEIAMRASKFLQREIPAQRWPNQDSMPENLTLSMIQGLVDDKIERLNELDIDNCQKLACDNPIIVWAMTSYNLRHILDWCAQAQLIVLFDAARIKDLRANGVRDIFGYCSSISDQDVRPEVQKILHVPIQILENHATMLKNNPCFSRLNELRAVL